MPEVISRLRRMQPDEAYVQAAQRVVLDCLAVKLGERLLIVYQQRAPFEELAAALMMAADEVGAEIDAVTVTSDETSPRLMAKLKERCDKAAASAMLAESNRSSSPAGTGTMITSSSDTTPAGTNRPRQRSAVSRKPRIICGGIHASETGNLERRRVREEK